MKKSNIKHYDKSILFKESFDDEQTVRNNGGIPTNLTFFNGVASFVAGNSTKVNYQGVSLYGTYSIHIRMTSIIETGDDGRYLLDFRGSAGTNIGYSYITTSTSTISTSSGTVYVDGVQTTTYNYWNIFKYK